ncbi:MAG: hypothetical protein IKI24_07910 [Clostridia bacterium]|nr:hypothetical protein [Clostridia bacterium]
MSIFDKELVEDSMVYKIQDCYCPVFLSLNPDGTGRIELDEERFFQLNKNNEAIADEIPSAITEGIGQYTFSWDFYRANDTYGVFVLQFDGADTRTLDCQAYFDGNGQILYYFLPKLFPFYQFPG